jgi:L-amino acid N-acyltransferase YncA
MPVLIRAATPDDLPAITAIYGDAVRHGTASFEIDPPDLTEMRHRFEALVAGGHPYLVAIGEGAVLGYAYAGPYRPRPAYRATVEDSIYLAREARGQGVGRLLLSELLDVCAARGFAQMIAVIGDSAQAPSIGLHKALGFRQVGTLEAVGFKFGRFLDTVLMQRAITT